MTGTSALPAGCAVRWDGRVRSSLDGATVLGGAPWRVLRIAPAGRRFVRRLRAAGPTGLVPGTAGERAVADLLVARGVAHPVPPPAAHPERAVEVVIPAYGRPDLLDACLTSLRASSPALGIVVVDDASPDPGVGAVARAHGATLLRHRRNRGPAAARNTGLTAVSAPVVAFLDADCVVGTGWLDVLAGHFDDPRVAAVAPRVGARGIDGDRRLLPRYQAERSPLDMGPRPQLVAHGAPLGFLPSAALLVRREHLPEQAFDERLRVGEDVDLIWRLLDAGHLVRYEPAAVVGHEIRGRALPWARRIFDYGTSAADLDRRHPGRLAPARPSAWNLAALALALAGRPAAAAATTALAAALLARTLRRAGVDPRLAPLVVGTGILADAAAAGHLLRREWWPLGWLALGTAVRSRPARLAAAAMLAPPVREWLTVRPGVDPARYLALRLAEDAAYGSGVIAGAVRSRRPGVLVPRVRPPWRRRR